VTDSSNSGGSSGSSTSSWINDLMNQTKQLTQSGNGPDQQFSTLQASEAAQASYVNAIRAHKTRVGWLGILATTCAEHSYCGGFTSAGFVRDNVLFDATTQQFLPALQAYIAYLDELEKTVDAAFKRMFSADIPTSVISA
jgi:hypothetical protein